MLLTLAQTSSVNLLSFTVLITMQLSLSVLFKFIVYFIVQYFISLTHQLSWKLSDYKLKFAVNRYICPFSYYSEYFKRASRSFLFVVHF